MGSNCNLKLTAVAPMPKSKTQASRTLHPRALIAVMVLMPTTTLAERSAYRCCNKAWRHATGRGTKISMIFKATARVTRLDCRTPSKPHHSHVVATQTQLNNSLKLLWMLVTAKHRGRLDWGNVRQMSALCCTLEMCANL